MIIHILQMRNGDSKGLTNLLNVNLFLFARVHVPVLTESILPPQARCIPEVGDPSKCQETISRSPDRIGTNCFTDKCCLNDGKEQGE